MEAAKRAGYSEKTADSQGQRLLKNGEVKQIVREKLEEEEVIAGEVLREMKRIGLLGPRTFFSADGNLKPVQDWTSEQAGAVASFEVVKRNAAAGNGHVDTIHKIRFWNKLHALETLCKHLGRLTPAPDDSGREVPTFIFPPGTRIKIADE
jgi:phage terminase small subunit